MNFKEKDMQGGKQRSSVAVRAGTTSGKMLAVKKRGEVPVRASLPTQELRRAQARRTQDYLDVEDAETVLLTEPKHRRSQERETWDDENIPVYSREKDHNFNAMAVIFGLLIMACLLFGASRVYAGAAYEIEHMKYGEHPITHFDGFLGLPGESILKTTHVIGINQNGVIVVLVVPPDPSQAKSYTMQTYTQFQSDAIPYVSKVMLHGTEAIEVQVDDTAWYLVKKGNTFVLPNQM